MTTALAVRGRDDRDPAKASGRLRRAAERYVKEGCKAIGPALVWAGYSQNTAKDPTANGYTHDYLVAVARYWNKGTQITARAHLGAAIAALRGMIDDPSSPPAARGAAAKVIIDVAGKEEEKQDQNVVAAEEQAKWMNQIRHWKRTFLRRGIMLGLTQACQDNQNCSSCSCGNYVHADSKRFDRQRTRVYRLLAELDWVLGKGPRPSWVGEEDEGVLGPEGDPRPGSYLEAEVVEEPDQALEANLPAPGHPHGL